MADDRHQFSIIFNLFYIFISCGDCRMGGRTSAVLVNSVNNFSLARESESSASKTFSSGGRRGRLERKGEEGSDAEKGEGHEIIPSHPLLQE